MSSTGRSADRYPPTMPAGAATAPAAAPLPIREAAVEPHRGDPPPAEKAARPPSTRHPTPTGSGGPLTLLIIGADPTDPFTVPHLLDPSGNQVRVRRARNLTEAARLHTQDVSCILLDLGLSQSRADDLGALREVLRMAPSTAVLALAGGQADAELATEAVRVGAQDYLFRDELSPALLYRAMRHAVERKRADHAQHQLTESRLLAKENARLERGLLPTPLLEGAAACGSPPATAPAAAVRCSAGTSTTSCGPRTAPSTR